MKTLTALFVVAYIVIGATATVPGYLVRAAFIAAPLYWVGAIKADKGQSIVMDWHF